VTRLLLIIVSDELSAIVRKGELTPRYYNPCNFFDKIHILMTNADKVDPAPLRLLVGSAELHLHNLPIPRNLGTRLSNRLGISPIFLGKWINEGVQLAKELKPDLIRCYGISYNALLAARIKKRLGIPFVVSLHNNPDDDFRGREATSLRQKTYAWSHKSVERPALRASGHFIAVYKTIIPYLTRNKVTNYSVIYNAVGYGAKPKDNYSLHDPARILCVGRQISKHKNPTHIVEAIPALDNTVLTLVGDGELHEPLVKLAKQLGCDSRCKFIPALHNEEVMKLLHESDVFVFNQIILGISKAVIEAALTGLPIIVNQRPHGATDELSADWLMQAEDSKEGYLAAMRTLLHDKAKREQLGRAAYSFACKFWAPEKLEEQVVEVYRQVMAKGSRGNDFHHIDEGSLK
jgi:glycosyltransferase involved in cell wall biosynthesis